MSVDGYLYLVSVILIAAACLFCVFIATRPDTGARCASPRKGLHPLRRAAAMLGDRDVWFWLASGQLLLPPGPRPIVSDREVREEWERLASRPEVRRHVNGRYLGTQPRRDRSPFTRADMPACPAPEPEPVQPDDDVDPAPPVLGFARSLVYGQACVLDVDEAERMAEAMRP